MTGLASFGATNSAQASETPVTPTLGDNSAYTLTKLESAPESTSSNIITNYVYDEVSGSLNKESYKYDLAKTEYGSGANTRYYKWVDGVMTRIETDASGNPLETPELTVKHPNSGATMWRPLNQTVNGHWYVNQNGSTLDGWGTTSSPFKSNVINSYFIESSATGVNGQTNHGGAIRGFSMSEYTGISGLFIGNHATASGGAIYNYVQYTYNPDDAYAIIGDINADFIGNYVNNTVGDFMEHGGGGAIFNSGIDGSGYNVEIGNITGNFIGNYVTTERLNVYGGAIQNQTAKIGDIKGDFVNNHITGTASDKGGYGGAIYNGNSHAGKGAVINSITGDFVGNYVKAGNEAHGGALYNGYDPIYLYKDRASTVTSITGNFYNNYVNADLASGGAIYNTGYLPDINANFIGNYASGFKADGGAIVNDGTIDHITGDFISNYASGSNAYGGAIYNNYGTIGDIKGDFIGNYASVTSSDVRGGAIYSREGGTIGDIKGDFIGNYAQSQDGIASGGAFYGVYYGTISGNFIDNYVKSTNNSAYGGAIYRNYGRTWLDLEGYLINSSFLGNYAKSESGTAQGGAIYSNNDFNLITQDGYTSLISGNYVEDKDGKRPEAIRLENDSRRMDLGYYAINGSTTKESLSYLIATPSILSLINDTDGKTIVDDQIVGGTEIIEEVYYYGDSGERQYVKLNEDGTYHDIETPEAVIVNSKLNITGDGTGLVQLNNDVINFDITLDNSTLHLGARDNVLDNNNLILNSGTLSMINNQAGVSALNSLTVTGDTNVLVDVDLKNQTMDRFTASEYGSHSGNLNVVGMNLLSDAVSDKTEILFAEQGLKDNVVNGITSQLPDNKHQTTLYTPIYKYNVAYDNRDDAGYFVFTRPTSGGSGGGSTAPSTPSVDAFNPAVLGSSTSATVGATATMNTAFNYSFQHSADFMNIPYLERVSMRDRNKYALSVTGDATDMGRFSPLYQPSQEEASVWVKPYATFETVGLKNGPKVHNNTYGTLIGFDTEMQTLKRGWDRVFTGYIGYNGASQRYAGIDSTQNGGLIGGTMTLYKGNFFNATTVSVGANVANNQTMYGSEDFAMLLSGIGNKTGYNFEFKEGKVILQPSMLMSYTFVNTFDYTNAAGVRIDNKPLHALQLAPGVKVIGNLKNGWQPYASVQMVWNLMGESDATANGVKLPEMSIKPYVQYGVGLQKRIKDHFTAYGQAMIQNGGRNGVSLTAGFRWALGHDKCKYKVDKSDKLDKSVNGHYEEQSDVVISSNNAIVARNDRGKCIRNSEINSESINAGKTLTPALSLGEGAKKEILRSAQNDRPERKILKQLSPEQKMALGGKYYNTSRTAKSGSLRQY